MFRMLNDGEKQYLRSNIENTLQEMQDYISSINIKGKNSADTDYLLAIIKETTLRKERMQNFLPSIKNKLAENECQATLFFFDDYEKRIKDIIFSLDSIVNGCNARIRDELPLDERLTICGFLRLTFPSSDLVKANICELSGCKTFDDFLNASSFKIHTLVLLKYNLRKKDLLAFLKTAQDVLAGDSSNIAFTELQRDYRYFLAGATPQSVKSGIEELTKKYEFVKDKRNIVDDHLGKQV